MPRLIRLVKLAVGALVALLAIWFEAVLQTPAVKQRKALRRRRRRSLANS